MLMVQQAIRDGDVRGVMTSTESSLRAIFIEKFNLDADYYNNN